MWKKILFLLFCPATHAGRWVWSWRAAVVSTCSQVKLVAVVMEHQQAVEVLPHF